jgi:hypothetical protein
MLISIALADRAEIIGLIAVLLLSTCIYLVQARLRKRAAAVPLHMDVTARIKVPADYAVGTLEARTKKPDDA